MEEDDYVRDKLTAIIERVEDEQEEEDGIPDATVNSVEENVINVNFKQRGGKT
jgi:hypothetical protein